MLLCFILSGERIRKTLAIHPAGGTIVMWKWGADFLR